MRTHKLLAIALFSAAITATSCKKSENNREAEAQSLYESAEEMLNAGWPEDCLALLDSLDNNYKGVNDVLRHSYELRPAALEMKYERDSAELFDAIIENEKALAALEERFITVTLPNVGFYREAKTVNNSKIYNITGITARVDDNGEFQIVSSLNPSGGFKHNRVTLVAENGDEASTSAVSNDNNFIVNNSELITFTSAQCDTLGSFILTHPDSRITCRFENEKGQQKSFALNKVTVEAIADAYHFASLMRKGLELGVEMANTQKLLQTARAQKAKR